MDVKKLKEKFEEGQLTREDLKGAIGGLSINDLTPEEQAEAERLYNAAMTAPPGSSQASAASDAYLAFMARMEAKYGA